jgi:hypothetical protein
MLFPAEKNNINNITRHSPLATCHSQTPCYTLIVNNLSHTIASGFRVQQWTGAGRFLSACGETGGWPVMY